MKLFSLKSIQFGEILQEVQRKLQSLTGNSAITNTSTVFGQLIYAISGIAHNIFLYIEDSLVEQNKYTAQRRKSIMGLAAQSGYQPSYGSAGSVRVKITPKPNNEAVQDIILNNLTPVVHAKTGLYYNLVFNSNAMSISPSSTTSIYCKAVQGRFQKQQFTSKGGKLYAQNFTFTGFLDIEYVEVYVNGEKWIRQESLIDMGPQEKAYMLRYNPTSGIDILFGNEINGRALNHGDVITLNYLVHDGESGNLDPKQSKTFIFANTANNVAGDSVDLNGCFTIEAADEHAVSSGSDPETTQQIARMIGFNTRSLVLSDANAYSQMLNKYSFVGYNRTWSEPGSLVVRSLVMSNFKQGLKNGAAYFDLNEDDFKLSTYQKSLIINAIAESGRMLIGTTYDLVDVELAKYVAYIHVKPKKNTDKLSIKSKITTLVGDFFANVYSDEYIPKSDIINLIKNNVSDVDGVDCYFLSERNEFAQRSTQRKYCQHTYTYDKISGTYKTQHTTISLAPGENPMLGLDAHGNIHIKANHQFPVLMGEWKYEDENGVLVTTQPLTITFED